MKILVTGATGNLGSKIVEHLLAKKTNEDIVVSVRNVEKANHLVKQGVEVRHGNFDDAASLDKAFEGVDRVVLVSTDGDTPTRIRQHATAIAAAQKAGVKRIVYTSLSNADTSSMNLAEVHKDTEARLNASKIATKILRNNWYLENETDTVKTAMETGVINSTYGDGLAGWMVRDDYALAAAFAALESDDSSKVYTLSNTLMTIDEFANVLASVIAKPVKVNHISDEALDQGLLAAGLPEGIAEFVVTMNRGIREGGLNAPSNDFEVLTQQKPKSLEEGLKILIGSF